MARSIGHARPNPRRWLGALMGAALVAAPLVAAPLVAGPASATPGFSTARLGGVDRYDTARLIAEAAYPGGSDTVLLASGVTYPDALAGAYLAGQQGVPILLTDPDTVPGATSQALSELHTRNVTVLGGSLAVSDGVVSTLSATASTSSAGGNLVVTRVQGPTRYDTAAAIAAAGGTVGTVKGARTALVASGTSPADALTAGPAAFAGHLPILLTDPAQESPQTEAALQSLGVTQVILVGGTGAVSTTAAQQLAANGTRAVIRVGGVDRTDTAGMFFNQIGLPDLGFSNTKVVLASAQDVPDALSGAVLAGKVPAAILFTAGPDALGAPTTAELTNHAPTLTSGVILGGTTAVSPTGQAAIAAAAGSTGTSSTTGGTASSGNSIALSSTTVAPGGTLAGTVTNPSTVTTLNADGCGVNTDETVNATGQFTVTIPATQPAGACSLLFTVTYSGLGPQVETFTITVSAATSGAVTLNQTTVQAGGTLTGNVARASSVAAVSASGCGLNGTVAFAPSTAQFSVTIPAGQPSGTCSLVFTVSYTDGTSASSTFTITVTGSTAGGPGPGILGLGILGL